MYNQNTPSLHGGGATEAAPDAAAVQQAIKSLTPEISQRLEALFGSGGLSFSDLDTRCIQELAKLHVSLQNKVVAHLESERVFLCNSRSKSRFLLSTCERARHGALDCRGFGAIDPWKSVLNSIATSQPKESLNTWEKRNGYTSQLWDQEGGEPNARGVSEIMRNFWKSALEEPRNIMIDVSQFPDFIDLLAGDREVNMTISSHTTVFELLDKLRSDLGCQTPVSKLNIRRIGNNDWEEISKAISSGAGPGSKNENLKLRGPIICKSQLVVSPAGPAGLTRLQVIPKKRGGKKVTKGVDLSKLGKGAKRVGLLGIRGADGKK